MSRISLYIVSEVLQVFSLTLLVMTAFVLLAVVGLEALREGLSLSAVVQLVPYSLPMALRFTVPGTLLFAVCSVYGRMADSNEMTAIRALGLAPWTLMRPALVVAVIFSSLTVWVNDIAVSWGTTGINRVILQSVEQIIYGRLRTQRSYSNQRGLSILVQDVQDRKLIRPTLTYQPTDGSNPIMILAEEAELRLDEAATALVILFRNMQVESEHVRGDVPGEFRFEIPLALAARKERHGRTPSDIPMRELSRELRWTQDAIARQEHRLTADVGVHLATGKFDPFRMDHWQQPVAEIQALRSRLYRLLTEPWRRWAAGFSCLAFVMVGVPLAMWLRTSDTWTTFGLCFLPILVVYYPLFMAGVDRAKAGAAPPIIVWVGNLVLMLVGLWLIRRANR